MKKIILDACCGGKMFWFNKNHPAALYFDNRKKPKGFMRVRPNFEINPDIVGDFKNLPFPDKSFKLVVFDPPHTIRDKERHKPGIIAERYGRLFLDTWEEDLEKGFKECWRVLEPHGVLIFKWAETDKKLKNIEPFFPAEPLFGHRSGSKNKTIWVCFMKFPK